MNFINKYSHPKNKRFYSFKYSLDLAKSRDLKTVVETGTSRGKKKFLFFSKYNWKDGKLEGEYIILKGSIAGPPKTFVRMRFPARSKIKKVELPKVIEISNNNG